MNTHSLSVFLLALAVAVPGPSAQTPAKPTAAKPKGAAADQKPSFKEHKLAAMDSWLTANKTAADRAEALVEAANLASELSKWTKARDYAELYRKEFAKGEKASEMQLLVGRAWSNLPGGEADAKKVFQAAIEAAGDNVNGAVAATMELIDLLLGQNDKEGATKALDALSDKFGKTRGLKEFLQSKRDELEELGSEPKPIDVTGLDGKPIQLAALKGKVVLLDFWATWCGPCVAELPNVIAAYQKFHAQGFEIIGISLDQDEKKLKDFLASHAMPWPQFFDGKGWQNELGQAYGVTSIPKTYLLDKAGKISKIGIRGEALGREVQKLLASKGEK